MKPVYQPRHMYPTKLENNYPYHLLDRDTRLFQALFPLLLGLFHLRFRGPRIRLFLMLALSKSLYFQVFAEEKDMHRYISLRALLFTPYSHPYTQSGKSFFVARHTSTGVQRLEGLYLGGGHPSFWRICLGGR
jgi:hypothetical protein